MNTRVFTDTAKALVAGDKGLLAMDESNPTCNKRFAALRIPQDEETRRAYREMIITTPGLAESISGAILYDETIRQKKKDGTSFIKAINDAGIIPGIKVDTGAKDLAGHPGEKITEGLDGLRERLAEYAQMGARFAKWRAVIAIGNGMPSTGCIEAKVNCFVRAVSAAVPGIAFLSGGQSAELASARLNAMNVRFKSRLPWPLAFSFFRAIQQPALEIWLGKEANLLAAQQTLLHRARCNNYARRGEYNAEVERHVHDNTVYKQQT
jgi:fructose-bisphosphate aldolase class 1